MRNSISLSQVRQKVDSVSRWLQQICCTGQHVDQTALCESESDGSFDTSRRDVVRQPRNVDDGERTLANVS